MKKFRRIIFYISILLFLPLFLLVAYIYLNKQLILKNIITSLNENLHATVLIKDLSFTIFDDFPRLSLTLIQLEVRDSLFNIYQTPTIRAGRVFLKVDALKLIRKNIYVKSLSIKNGSLNIFKSCDGYSNSYIFKSAKTDSSQNKETSQVDFMVHDIHFKNVSVTISDSLRQKNFGFNLIDVNSILNQAEKVNNIQLAGIVFFKGLLFNDVRGAFLLNQKTYLELSLELDNGNKKLNILPKSFVTIYKRKNFLSGDLDFNEPPTLTLIIKNDALLFEDAQAILNRHIISKLNKFRFDGPIAVVVTLRASLITQGVQPFVDVKAKSNGVSLSLDSVEISEIKFDGTFCNHVDSLMTNGDENTTLVFKNFEGQLEGIPVKGNFMIHNLKVPETDASLESSFQLKDKQDIVNPGTILLRDGSVHLKINYKGPLSQIADKVSHKVNGILTGSYQIANASLTYIPKKFQFTKVNMHGTFDQNEFKVSKFSFLLNNNFISATGKIKNLIPFIFVHDVKVESELNISSPEVNIESFLLPSHKPKSYSMSKKKSRRAVASAVDDIIQKLELKLNLHAHKIIYKDFTATNTKGSVAFIEDSISLKNFYLEAVGGVFNLDASYKVMNDNHVKLIAEVNISHGDISRLFESFNNFGQQTITGKNINGTVSTTAKFNCLLDTGLNFLPETVNGDVDLHIKKGKLINFEPLRNLTKVIFKNRDFSNIEFEEITGHLIMKGKDIDVGRIDIVSPQLSFAVTGVYSLKENTDLSIQVPLHNLKQQKNIKIKTTEDLRNYSGANIYLRARPNNDGKIKISYDPFKKMRKGAKDDVQ